MVERLNPGQLEQAEPPYWQEAVEIGRVEMNGEFRPLFLRLHIANERYSERARELGVDLSEGRGPRVYVQGRPSIIEPEITLRIGLHNAPSADGSIGEVEGTSYEGVRWREVGNAQAWYYPKDKWVMLWECYLQEWFRQEQPQDDATLHQLWDGFERILWARFPDATRLVTPNWETTYDTAAWRAFLETRGYRPVTDQAMAKARGRPFWHMMPGWDFRPDLSSPFLLVQFQSSPKVPHSLHDKLRDRIDRPRKSRYPDAKASNSLTGLSHCWTFHPTCFLTEALLGHRFCESLLHP